MSSLDMILSVIQKCQDEVGKLVFVSLLSMLYYQAEVFQDPYLEFFEEEMGLIVLRFRFSELGYDVLDFF